MCNRSSLLISSAGFVLALAMAPAFAQDASTEAGSPRGGLDEIVVTAQKREENVQKAAVAITAVDSDTLARKGVTDASQLTQIVPALNINQSFGPTSTFYIRGVGNFVANVQSDPAVVVNLDGVALARPTGVNGMFFDIERVEVLKGPQGTLYGRNATGGTVNIITAQPKLGETSGFVNASYGNYDAAKFNGALNLPIGDSAALRIAGMTSDRNGTYSDGQGDEQLRAVRATFKAELSDAVTISIAGDFAHQGGVGTGATPAGLNVDDRIGLFDPRANQAIYNRPVNPAPFPFSAAGFNGISGAVLQNPNNVPGLVPFQDNDFYGIRGELNVDTSVGTITLIPSYRRADLNFLALTGPAALVNNTDEQTSVELRLTSPSENRLKYIFGALYFNERVDSQNHFNFQTVAFNPTFQPKTDSYAGYARLTFDVTDAFRLTGGIRYTVDQKSITSISHTQRVVCPGFLDPFPLGTAPYSVNPPCVGTPLLPVSFDLPAGFPGGANIVPFPGGGVLDLNYAGVNGAFLQILTEPNVGDKTFKKVTWRAAAEFDVGPDSLLFASVETGYKAGGFFASPDQNRNFFNPETITAYTIGSKNRLLDNRLQLNLEAFWWDYSDQQVSHFINVENPAGSGRFQPVFGTENIGKSRLRGVEVEMRAQIADETEIDGTVQYLDAENTDYVFSSALPPTTGCPFAPAAGGGFTVDCSGTDPANSPKWTVQGGITHHFPLANGGDVMLRAQTRYQSGSFRGPEVLAEQYQDGYFMSGAQVEFRPNDSGFSIAGFVDNIENNDVVGYATPHSFAGGQVFKVLLNPRTYGVRVGYEF
ncbi:MAG: TonB-dependent receptor [Caulobacterales bacterium]|nr:TonB-dependent receptor [Caulobacterales bacterium]